MAAPKIAIVCDWLTNMGGAERVVLALHQAFPEAPIYTSVFDPHACPTFAKLDVRTTYLQKLPGALRNRHQLFPLLRHHAFRSLDLSSYDVVISSASAEAKAVRVRPGATHICYCHTPIRYYWSHYQQYLAEPGFGSLDPLARAVLPALVKFLRRQDLQAVAGVNYFIANSSTVKERINQYYHREADVIHPPVDMERFRPLNITSARRGFVALGRQVAYKRHDLAILACNALGVPLTIYGNGPEHERLQKLAGKTVSFVTNASDEDIAQALTTAEALLFPQLDDFGIVQIEAMAAGCPVIAYAKGGALDAVIDKKTGLFFPHQTADSLAQAITTLQSLSFDPHTIQAHAETFSTEQFIDSLRNYVAAHHSL